MDALNENIFKIIGSISDEMNTQCFVVGGWVRDQIMNRENSMDIDIVAVGNALDLAKKCSKDLKGSKVSVFKKFGTAHFKVNNINIEFVQARSESYTPDSRKPKVEASTLKEDQLRRDFTINSLAISLNKESWGKLVDPFDGTKDLKNKIIRTPLKAEKTFADDPLRMLRAIRFACQLNFKIEPKTFHGIKESANRISILSAERIHVELNKIMLCNTPSIGLALLQESGLMPLILPEVSALEGVDEIEGHMHKDNFWHTLQVVDNLAKISDDLWHRWSALLHDIGKPPVKKFVDSVGWTFHGHEYLGGKMARSIFKRLSLPQDERLQFVMKLIRMSSRPIAVSSDVATESAVRRLLFDAGNSIDSLMELCEADITTKNPKRKKKYLENFKIVRQRLIEVEKRDKLRNWQPPVDGVQLMKWFNLSPGKEIGKIKALIREAVLDGEISNTFEAAKKLAYDYAKENRIIELKDD